MNIPCGDPNYEKLMKIFNFCLKPFAKEMGIIGATIEVHDTLLKLSPATWLPRESEEDARTRWIYLRMWASSETVMN